jgi:hypothetical protein
MKQAYLGSIARSSAHELSGHDLFLGFLLILLSGSPAFVPVLIPAVILLTVMFLFSDQAKTKQSDVLVFGIFLVLTIIQVLSLPQATIYTSLGFFARLLVAFMVVRMTENVTLLIIWVITFIAILACFIFALDTGLRLFGVDLSEVLKPISLATGSQGDVYAVIQNFKGDDDRGRNAGIFWEPGALSGYCLVGLILLGISRDRHTRKEVCIIVGTLVAAILSTFSTTGYVLLPLVLLISILPRASIKPSRLVATLIIVLPVLLAASIGIAQLPFVREKIQQQVFAVGVEGKKWQLNRIGQLVNDLDDFMIRPTTGWGANPRIRPSAVMLDDETQTAQGNGLAIFLVQYGLIGFGAFVIASYRNLRQTQSSPVVAGYAVLLLCLTLVGEAFLNFPLFLTLMFLPNGGSSGSPILVRLILKRNAGSLSA